MSSMIKANTIVLAIAVIAAGMSVAYVPEGLEPGKVQDEGLRQPGSGKASVIRSGKGITVEAINYVMVFIPPGTFTMGSPKDEPDRSEDEVQHQVTLSRGFYLGITEVTQGQWRKVSSDTRN